ncbi:MAG: response regulator [Acidobacteria bacterium]|nr:response regulator [Acidobacteriota bacterium]
MALLDDEERLLRTVALQNATSILLARRRAEEELSRTKDALRNSQERLQAALSAAGTGTFRWNVQTNAIDWDDNLDRLLGRVPGETAQSFDSFISAVHPDDRAGVIERCKQCARDGCDFDMEFRVVWPDGSVHWIDDKAKTFFDEDGRPLYMMGACTDTTSRKLAAEALRASEERLRGIASDNARLYEAAQKAADEREVLLESERAARSAAERMSEMKDEFLATLSHELRTPLNAILGWSQILRHGTMDEADVSRGLETIERNARVQTQLIEDLLDMSRIASGKLRLDIQPVQPEALVEAAIETVKPAADAKSIRLETFLDPSAGPISGDPGRLQQVIWNLLSNAIKFTPKNGKVQILLERVDSHIEISVADTGIGIKAEFIPHLFERFRQAEASTTRKFGGLGLGLSIVKNLVELHGGTVEVRSAGEGLGTTVSVHLPLMVVHRTADASQRLHPTTSATVAPGFVPANLSGVRVLVVDDQADARDLIKRVLEDCSAEVVTAGSVNEAVQLVESAQPDVLVSDIGMPEADGFELLKRVRALGAGRGGKVPAIALTAFARSEDRTRALRAGFLVHVSKPVDPSELVATVASVAGRVDGA